MILWLVKPFRMFHHVTITCFYPDYLWNVPIRCFKAFYSFPCLSLSLSMKLMSLNIKDSIMSSGISKWSHSVPFLVCFFFSEHELELSQYCWRSGLKTPDIPLQPVFSFWMKEKIQSSLTWFCYKLQNWYISTKLVVENWTVRTGDSSPG